MEFLFAHLKPWNSPVTASLQATVSEILLPVVVADRHPGNGASVTSQEEEGDVAGGGDQVDQHGHAYGSQRRQVELLHQQAAHEDPQTRARNGRHACVIKHKPGLLGW